MTRTTEDHGPRTWPEAPTPFLSQPRAQSALRREFDAIVHEIEPAIDRCRAARPDGAFELIVLPHRVVARIGGDAVTFSWVSGRVPTVADGCLLVIAWSNVASDVKGVAALRSATPTRERTYVAGGASAEEWRWCTSEAREPREEPQSTKHLTAEWMARTTIAIAEIPLMR